MKVNGIEIPVKAVEYELNRLIRFHAEHGMQEEQLRAELPTLKKKAEEQAVGTALLFQEAAALDLAVSDEEVEEAVDRMRSEAGGDDRFRAILHRQGKNIVQLRAEIKRGKKVDKLVEKVCADAGEPTEDEAKAFFDAHRGDFGKDTQVRAQHILVAPKGKGDEAKAEALAKIKAIRERVLAGSDFSEEAAAHSDCPSGKQAGGSLGWFSPGMMVKEFDEAAFSLPVGGLSEIVETQFGYHVILKNDEIPASTPEFLEARDKVMDLLRHDRRGKALAQHVEELRKNATIEQ
ncbi:MAG: peptidylprolyl isomerase [Kiritimatiellae bacterium]|nr:peptidylprolyl isomerase [Kiritimatiellia bacterium]